QSTSESGLSDLSMVVTPPPPFVKYLFLFSFVYSRPKAVHRKRFDREPCFNRAIPNDPFLLFDLGPRQAWRCPPPSSRSVGGLGLGRSVRTTIAGRSPYLRGAGTALFSGSANESRNLAAWAGSSWPFPPVTMSWYIRSLTR